MIAIGLNTPLQHEYKALYSRWRMLLKLRGLRLGGHAFDLNSYCHSILTFQGIEIGSRLGSRWNVIDLNLYCHHILRFGVWILRLRLRWKHGPSPTNVVIRYWGIEIGMRSGWPSPKSISNPNITSSSTHM